VLEADRDARRRKDEGTGEVEPLTADRLSKMKMGDRVQSSRADLDEKLQKSRTK